MMPNQRLKELLHLRSPREIMGAGFLIAVICWYFGDDVWHAILLGCAITVIVLALLVGSSAPVALDLSWRPGERSRRKGSRTELVDLATSLHRDWGFVGPAAQLKLQQIARRRLEIEGLDLDNTEHRPAIEQRIGADAYRVLVSSQSQLPTLKALLSCLDSLDAIDSTHHAAPQPRAHRWDLPVIPFSRGRTRER